MAGSTTTAKYVGTSMEDLLRMPVMATQYEYEQEKKLQDMMDEAAVLEILKNESQDADVYTQYAEFQNRLKDQIRRGQQQGFSTVARDLYNTNQDYHSTIEPIKNAYNRREEARKTYNDAILKDPSLITNINPNEIGLSAYMGTNERTVPQMYALSGNAVMTEAAKEMSKASKNRVFNKPVEYAMDNLLFKIQSGYGYTENDIDRLMAYPEIKEIADKIKSSPEVQRLGNNKAAVDEYIVRGILQGREYDNKVSYMNAPKPTTPTDTTSDGLSLDSLDPLTGIGSFYMTDVAFGNKNAGKYLDGDDNVIWNFNRTTYSAPTGYGKGVETTERTSDNSKEIFPIIRDELLEMHPEFAKKGYSDKALFYYYFGDTDLTPSERAEYKKQAEDEGILQLGGNRNDKREEIRQALLSRRAKDTAIQEIPIYQSHSKWDKANFVNYLLSAEPRSVHVLEAFNSKENRYVEAKDKALKDILDGNVDNMSDITYGFDPSRNQFIAQFNKGELGARREKNKVHGYTIGFTPSLTLDERNYLQSMFGQKYTVGNKTFDNQYQYLTEVYNNLNRAIQQNGGEASPELMLQYLSVVNKLTEVGRFFNDFRFDKTSNKPLNTNTASGFNEGKN